MVAELRLELDRIERSIVILETLACPNRTKRAAPAKRGSSPLARLAGSRAARIATRENKVISIERRTSRPPGEGTTAIGPEEKDVLRSLSEMRSQTAKFQEAISSLIRKPGD